MCVECERSVSAETTPNSEVGKQNRRASGNPLAEKSENAVSKSWQKEFSISQEVRVIMH